MFKSQLLKLASSALLTSLTLLTLGATATRSQAESNDVTFFCGQMFDRAANENIPATTVWVPERKAHVHLIAWKSDYFYKWNRQERCDTVSQKFRDFYKQGRLNYLTYGEVNNSQVICAVANQGERCDSENMLFTVKPQDYPNIVLERLMGILVSNASPPLYQSTGKQVYVSVSDFFRQAPIAEGASSSR